jgi:hypothetical protein
MNTTPNPKCSMCRTYFMPTLKSSGLPYKCCDKCRENSSKHHNDNKCIHNKRRERCVDCEGSSICIHNKRRERCVDCGGSSICIHDKRKDSCKECKKQ